MAQDLTVTVTRGNPFMDCYAGGIDHHKAPMTISLDWQSAAAGTVSMDIASTYSGDQVDANWPKPTKLRGYINQIRVQPDTGGTAPTAGWTLALLDSLSNVIFSSVEGTGNAIHDQDPPLYVDDELTLTIAGAGNTKGGIVYLEMVP